ncbi:MAG: isoaspartyl peptidase/L-asparaginase [Gammaproteobacteria bacterium]|nr:isoaspartyl peptidase/L-asparaginase [Gammaproteobacteria bacterium]
MSCQRVFCPITVILAGILLLGACTEQTGPPPYGLVIHGGAGSGTRADISPDLEKRMRAAMSDALDAGITVLKNGGSSLDAVTEAIQVLEDAPEFNSGRGAVFNAQGGHELDASIMDGSTLAAGAVAGVKTVKNPILLARAVMERSPHVMMAGDGAEAFALSLGMVPVSPDYFDTGRRKKQLDRALQKLRNDNTRRSDTHQRSDYFGTVGVVALDSAGNLAAGTSTGGMTAKRFGRVGDSPIIGAGTYANNDSCAVSSTGHGEFFIRHVVAYSICARMQFDGMSVQDAADDMILRELAQVQGSGGVIAMDARGNVAWPYNTASMIRAHQSRDSEPRILLFETE